MKNKLQILQILMIIIMTLIIESCSDIVDSDKNKIIEFKNKDDDSTDTIKQDIYFRFEIYSLDYQINDTTLLWTIVKPNTFGRTFNVVNKKSKDNFVINSISVQDGQYFDVVSLLPLPYILEPKTVNSKHELLVTLNTENLSKGIYTDKLIINNDPNLGFYIRVEVK